MEKEPLKFSDFLRNKDKESAITSLTSSPTDKITNPVFSGDYGFDIEPFGSKLSDGTYSFKNQNIRTDDTPQSLEERYSSKQSTFDKWQNGLAKAHTKVGLYAADALVGTAYGIVNSISKGSLNALYDNEFSNYIDDLNTELDNALPNYYSQHEKEAGFINSLGTANFWANDFAGGLAFLGGTVLSEGVLSIATGGSSLATTLPRMAIKSAIKKGAKIAGKETLEFTAKKTLLNTMKDKIVKRGALGEGLDLVGFSARSSIYEAGMEARLATKEAVDNYIATYKNTYGEEPSGEELTAFINDAKNASNGVFAANLAILVPSNLLMFGKLGTKSIKETSNSFINNKLFGLGYNKVKDKAGKLSLEAIKPNALQKVTGNSYQLLKGPVTEGLWEEGMQGVATKTMMNYLGDKYNSKNNIENLSLTNSFYDAFAEQYGTSAGWKENLLGSMIGAVGGSFTSFNRGLKGGLGSALKNTEGIGGFGKQSYRSMVKENVDNVNAMNKASENMLERANNLSAMSENVKRQQVGDSKDISYTESQTYGINEDWSYINTMAPHKTKDEIKEDYAYSINNMEISSEVQKENGFSEEQIEQYKNDKIEKFNSRVDAALKAKQAVKYLNLELGVTPGNKAAIEDAFAYNLYTGTNSLENAKDLSSQLDNIVGKEGTFSAINYFNNLTEDQKKASDRIKELKEEIEGLKAKSFKLAKLPKLSTFNSTTNKTETFAEKQRQKNLEIVKLTDLLNDKEAEKAELENKLDKKVTFNNIFGKSEDILGQGPIEGNITQMFEDLEAVDSYIKSLEEEGLTVEANSVSNLLKEIKFNLDSSREVAKQFDAMSRPGFFKKKGLSKLLETITGDKYSMSEDTIQLIRDNDEKVRKSLALSGLVPTKNTEDYIKEIIEGADNFSDKNKFHLEMMIRNIIKAEDLEFSLPEAPTSVAPLDVVKNGIKRSGAKLKNIEVDISNNPSLDYLNEVIDKIIESSNQLGDLISLSDPRVKEIQTKINELKAKKNDPNRLLAIEQFKNELEIEKGLEFGTVENEKDLESKIEELETEVDKELEKLESELSSIIKDTNDNKFKPEVKDYKRLETLLKKQDRTDKENSELENLKQFIDQWIKLDGTVADGVVLSDLIEQKIQLESQDVVEETPVTNQTDSEIFESSNSVAINGTQGFTVSFNKLERGKLAITGISFKGLIEKINPLNKSQLPQEVDSGDVVIVELEKGNLEITVNEVGGLEIKKEQIELINSTTIKVINTSENQGTNFNVTLEENERGIKAVESDFGGDYVEGDPNEVAIYETQAGEEVTLKINLEDKHNQKLINSLPTKKSSKKINLEDEIENALEDDKTLKKLNEELSENSNLLEEIEEKLEQKNTTDVKAKLLKEKSKTIKKIETLDSSILKRENEVITKVENTVRTGSTSKKISKEALAKLKKELVISVYTNRGENGNFTGTLKSQRGLDKDSVSIDTAKFNALRDQLVDKYLDTILEGSTETITLTETVSVQDVYLGHPNYNFERKGSKIVTRFDNIPQNRVKDIVDIGFIEKGSRFLRNKTKDVDTTFISKFKKNKGKTGIIVLNHFGRNIAYPVNTNERNVDFASKLKETFAGQKPSKELANNLNDILVEAGVDIKKEGFVFVSEKSRGNNLNDKEISNKVAQLEEKQYFYNLENWESSDNNMENTILNEMKINIDLNKPFHSPKFMLDFSKIEVKIPENTVINKSKGSQGSSSIADKALGCKG